MSKPTEDAVREVAPVRRISSPDWGRAFACYCDGAWHVHCPKPLRMTAEEARNVARSLVEAADDADALSQHRVVSVAAGFDVGRLGARRRVGADPRDPSRTLYAEEATR